MHADDPLKLRNYWIEVRYIYTLCCPIIANELLKIRMAILLSLSECKGYE